MALHTALLGEHSQLSEANAMLEQKVQLQAIKINQLEQKYDSLKMAKTIEAGSEDVHSTKIKINRMVREIDKCIALLNK